MLRTFIAAGLLIAAVNTAFAANPNFCANYARAALNQVRVARHTPPCMYGANGPRWSPFYRVHFNWCLGVPWQFAAHERAMRTRYLRSCRGF